MIWAGRRDRLEGDMNPLVGMPSSSVGYLMSLLVWSSIQSPAEILMIQIRGEKKQSNMIAQRNLRGALKVCSLLQLLRW